MLIRWACILAFDVRVERDAQEMADGLGVRIFTADIIYHLFDNFIKYREVKCCDIPLNMSTFNFIRNFVSVNVKKMNVLLYFHVN